MGMVQVPSQKELSTLSANRVGAVCVLSLPYTCALLLMGMALRRLTST